TAGPIRRVRGGDKVWNRVLQWLHTRPARVLPKAVLSRGEGIAGSPTGIVQSHVVVKVLPDPRPLKRGADKALGSELELLTESCENFKVGEIDWHELLELIPKKVLQAP